MNLKTFTWDKLKKPGVPPGPRSGFAMTVHKRRFIIWGGVRDEEENDNLRSTFYNDMYPAAHPWLSSQLRRSPTRPHARRPSSHAPPPTAAGSHPHRYAYQMDNRRWFGLNLRKVKKKGAKRKPGKGTAKPGSAAAVGDAEDERACSDGSDEEQEGGRRARVLVPLANRDAEEIEEWDDWERSAAPARASTVSCV